jgi:hypothetical protein
MICLLARCADNAVCHGAASEPEARELALPGEPTTGSLRLRDGIWVATLMPDLTVLVPVEPDQAGNRCRFVFSPVGVDVTWMYRETNGGERWGLTTG